MWDLTFHTSRKPASFNCLARRTDVAAVDAGDFVLGVQFNRAREAVVAALWAFGLRAAD
jgi:hypothetical protein